MDAEVPECGDGVLGEGAASPFTPARGSGERCELLQQGTGQSPKVSHYFQHSGWPLLTLWTGLSLDRTGLSLLNGFSFLVNFFLFSFGSCSRLSWLNCQLSSARYYSIFTYLLTYLL